MAVVVTFFIYFCILLAWLLVTAPLEQFVNESANYIKGTNAGTAGLFGFGLTICENSQCVNPTSILAQSPGTPPMFVGEGMFTNDEMSTVLVRAYDQVRKQVSMVF